MRNIYIKNIYITDKHIIIPKYEIKLDKDEILYTLHKNSNILLKTFTRHPIKLNKKYYYETNIINKFITFFCKNLKDLFYINVEELILKLNLYGHNIDTNPYSYGKVKKYDLIDIYSKNIHNYFYKIENNNLIFNNVDHSISLNKLYDMYYNDNIYIYIKSNFQKVIDYLYSFYKKTKMIDEKINKFEIYIDKNYNILTIKCIYPTYKFENSINLYFLDEIIENYKKYIQYKNIYTIPKKKLINKLNIYIVDIIYKYLLGISLLNDMKIY